MNPNHSSSVIEYRPAAHTWLSDIVVNEAITLIRLRDFPDNFPIRDNHRASRHRLSSHRSACHIDRLPYRHPVRVSPPRQLVVILAGKSQHGQIHISQGDSHFPISPMADTVRSDNQTSILSIPDDMMSGQHIISIALTAINHSRTRRTAIDHHRDFLGFFRHILGRQPTTAPHTQSHRQHCHHQQTGFLR